VSGRLAVIYEITEKKRAQQEFIKQQWKLATVEERERMARDLHDNLGQVLGFINLQAQGIRQELINAGIEKVSPKLDRLVAVTQTAHTEIREYIRNIRNSANMDKDFITALTDLHHSLLMLQKEGLISQTQVEGENLPWWMVADVNDFVPSF
jgi:signal transduction histidine kinase